MRVLAACLSVCAALALAGPAVRAQGVPSAPPAAQPPAPAPTTLESLFQRLRAAKDPNEGRAIAKQIEQRWLRSPSDTATLLMTRVNQAMTANARETGIDLIDYILLLQPQWAEAYNKRATILFLMDDYDGALRDIRAALRYEPRHFGAMAGLGMIMQRMGNTKGAYAAFRKALEVHPQLNEVREAADRLKTEVEGQEL